MRAHSLQPVPQAPQNVGARDLCATCGSRPVASSVRVRYIDILRQRDGENCHLCSLPMLFHSRSRPINASVDHLIPRSLQGCDCLPNLRLAHTICNERRGNRRELIIGFGTVMKIVPLLRAALPRGNALVRRASSMMRTGAVDAHLAAMRRHDMRAYHKPDLAAVAS